MKVNDEEHSTTITEMSSKDAIFEYPGKDHNQLLKPAICSTTTLRSFQCRWSRYERSRRKVTLKIEFIDNNIYCTTCTAARYNIHILKYFTQHVRSAAPLALIKFLNTYNYINKPINIAYSQAISSLESPLMARRALLDVSLTLRSTLCDLWT